MRHCHTLKGVVNTVGLTPTGEMLHRVEDLLETSLAAAILPPMRNVATLLLAVQGDRAQAPEAAPSRATSRPTCPGSRRASPGCSARRPGRRSGRAAPVWPAPPERSGGTASGAASSSMRSARSLRSRPQQSAAVRPPSNDDGVDRRYIRVATDRLDALMNLAGELVVSRSRLLSRVTGCAACSRSSASAAAGCSRPSRTSATSTSSPTSTGATAGRADGARRPGAARAPAGRPARCPTARRAGSTSASSSSTSTRTSTSSAGA